MAGCDQSTGAEIQLSRDDNEPSTVTSIEQVSNVCLNVEHSNNDGREINRPK